MILIYFLIAKSYVRYNNKLRNKVLFSAIAFALALVFIAIVENAWFEIKGEMLFNGVR